MRVRALLMACGAWSALAGFALAEPPAAPPVQTMTALPPARVVADARASGFDPLGAPVRSGETYALLALDRYDVEYRLVVDARTGRTLSLRQIATPGPYQPMPLLARNDGPGLGQIFGRTNDGWGTPRPPRAVPHARPLPPGATAQAPLPRPKPYVMEATGSIPVDAAKSPGAAKNPAAQAPAPAKNTPQTNGGAAMPPVAPLD
jgi:hypothetical protein